MTALALVAAWHLQAAMHHYQPDDLRAVGYARLDQLLALPGVERDLLIRLVWSRSTTEAGADRQKGFETWH